MKPFEPIKQFNIHLPIKVWEDLHVAAAKAGVTKSDYVRSAIIDAIKGQTIGTTINEASDRYIVPDESAIMEALDGPNGLGAAQKARAEKQAKQAEKDDVYRRQIRPEPTAGENS